MDRAGARADTAPPRHPRLDSSVSPVHGKQEESAYNSHFFGEKLATRRFENLQTYLRVFRGVHKQYLGAYVATIKAMTNAIRITEAIIQRMCFIRTDGG